MTIPKEALVPLPDYDKDIMRVIEKCLDVLLTPHTENHPPVRELLRFMSHPRWATRRENP